MDAYSVCRLKRPPDSCEDFRIFGHGSTGSTGHRKQNSTTKSHIQIGPGAICYSTNLSSEIPGKENVILVSSSVRYYADNCTFVKQQSLTRKGKEKTLLSDTVISPESVIQ